MGASPLAIAALLKLTPESWMTKMKVDKVIDENRAGSSALLKMYKNTEKMKVTDFKKKETDGFGEEDNDFKNFK